MMTLSCVTLASGIRIGPGHPCFIVAEIGNNHQGDMDIARRMVREAAAMGVDAVKFQKRDVDSLLTREARDAAYTGGNSFGPTYGAHRAALELDMWQMAELKALAESLGLVFFASAWDPVSLRQIGELGVELLKICSADLVNIPLLRQAAALRVPLVLSTGMSTWKEMDAALAELQSARAEVVLLHCNSSYPCPDGEVCLPVMLKLRDRYGLPTGYSGHERGLGPSVAAAAMGACLVERHFTLDKTMRGTDHQASLAPDEFRSLVGMIREVEKASRGTDKTVFPAERRAAVKLRKSVAAVRALPAGHVLAREDLTVKSPGAGISPLSWDLLPGRVLAQAVPADHILTWDMIAPSCSEPADAPAGTLAGDRPGPPETLPSAGPPASARLRTC